MSGLKIKTDYLNCSFTSKNWIKTSVSVFFYATFIFSFVASNNVVLSVVRLTLSQIVLLCTFTLGKIIESRHVQG